VRGQSNVTSGQKKKLYFTVANKIFRECGVLLKLNFHVTSSKTYLLFFSSGSKYNLSSTDNYEGILPLPVFFQGVTVAT
jgi:hypothetical protein